MDFGVSFSLKYAQELDINAKACLEAALKELGVRRLRLMSYWDIHERERGKYDFKDLDWQFALAKKYGARVSLAIGLRQPRWPESHWPKWAKKLNEDEWQNALSDFIRQVVQRYKDHECLESWQLENEALLKTFGQNGNFDRNRLRRELKLVKQADPTHPVIMSTSDSWGIPFWQPRPDMFGISIYRRFHNKGVYKYSHRGSSFYKIRGKLIRLLTRRPVFIHELQTEPWGPRATVSLSREEQAVTMNAAYLSETVGFAKRTGLLPAYLWGMEWWYWLRVTHNDDSLWQAAQAAFKE